MRWPGTSLPSVQAGGGQNADSVLVQFVGLLSRNVEQMFENPPETRVGLVPSSVMLIFGLWDVMGSIEAWIFQASLYYTVHGIREPHSNC